MLKFRASGLLAFYFFFQAFNCFEAHQWMTMVFDIILALCLTSCYFNRPLHVGNIIEFGGW